MHRWSVLLVALVVTGCSAAPQCQHVSVSTQSQNPVAEQLAHELAQEHEAGTFDGLVWVAKGNHLLVNGAYGCANRERGVANSTSSISDMGSIAKTFTAAAVLQLAQSGQLQLSNTLGDFYPTAPEAVKPITLTQLLAHSSGMDNFHNDSDFEPMNKAEAVSRILSMPLIAKPGERVAYSNAAYTLLAAIVAQVSEKPFQTYVQENLLAPLNLANTGFYQDTRLSLNNLARGYGGDDPGQTTFEKGLTWALVGAGGMVTSVNDLATWATALQSGAILPAGAPNLAFTEVNERWLLGSLTQVEIQGERVIQMGGSTDYGYTALIQFVPSQELLVVLLLNAHNNKYNNATHHRLSRNHILPILLEVPPPST